jgi:hypothetical protein
LESGVWRWTAGKFAVNLLPPAQSATHGAKLTFKLVVPEPVIQKLNSVTLSAKVGDASLPPETYTKSGEYLYTRDVPASALRVNSVRVNFSLDKFLAPSSADNRELGIIAEQVALEPK